MDLSDIKKYAKEDIKSLFSTFQESSMKILVLEPCLDRFLFLTDMFDTELLKSMNVEEVVALTKLTHLKVKQEHEYIFLLRPQHSTCIILRQILEDMHKQSDLASIQSHICFVPNVSIGCAHIIHHILQHKTVHVHELDIDFLPVDTDVLSTEMSNSYNDIFILNDPTLIHTLSRAFLKLQAVHLGRFHNVTAHGQQACAILRLMRVMQHTFLSSEQEKAFFYPQSELYLESAVIVDRSIDIVGPLLYQQTYEGLIDLIFDIRLGKVDLPQNIADHKNTSYGTISLWNDDDSVFSKIRDFNFAEVGRKLNSIVCEIQDDYNDRHDIHGVSHLRQFVQTLPAVQRKHKLSILHTKILEALAREIRHKGIYRHLEIEMMIASDDINEEAAVKYVQECMFRRFSFAQTLRIILLIRYSSSFWSENLWEKLKRLLVESYGALEVISCLDMLQDSKLLENDGMNGVWNKWKTEQFSCSETEKVPNYQHPSIITHAFDEFVHNTLFGSESLNTFDFLTKEHSQLVSDVEIEKDSSSTRVFMLFVVGGISVAEIRAIRAMERSINAGYDVKIRIIVASSNIINGKKFVQSIFGDVTDRI